MRMMNPKWKKLAKERKAKKSSTKGTKVVKKTTKGGSENG